MVYLDSSLKHLNSNLYEQILIKSNEFHFEVEEFIPNKMSIDKTEGLLFYSSGLDDLILSKKNKLFLVEVSGINLNLLESTSTQLQTFNATSIIEIDQAFELYKILLDKKKSKIKHELEFKRNKILKKNKKLIMKFDEHFSVSFLEQLYTVLFSDVVIENVVIELNGFLSENGFGNTHFSLKTIDINSDLKNLLYVDEIDSQVILMRTNHLTSIKELSLLVLFQERLKVDKYKVNSVNESTYWTSIYDKIQVPLVLFNSNKELIVSSKLFKKLNLSAQECFEFENNDEVVINSINIRVSKKLINTNVLFLFYENKDLSTNKPSSEELGIVSSSIAHELNNPLAGILAAIEVLELDEYEDDDVSLKLEEMKASVKRSKKLVETFLGFSKSSIKKSSNDMSIQEAITQAVDLLKFRLVENNLNFSFEYKKNNDFLSTYNPYMITMIFYLIFGDILTSTSHRKLVENKNDNFFDITIIEDLKTLSVKSREITYKTLDKNQSRLFNHMIESEKIKFHFEDGTINISKL